MFSPLLGFIGAFLVMIVLLWLFARADPRLCQRVFGRAQIAVGRLHGFSHGSNDAQKTMGVITMALASYLRLGRQRVGRAAVGDPRCGDGDGPRHGHRRLADHRDDGAARSSSCGRSTGSRPRPRRPRSSRSPAASASRSRRPTSSARRSWVWARRAALRRCAGASPGRSSWPGWSPIPACIGIGWLVFEIIDHLKIWL